MIQKNISIEAILIGICVFFGAFISTKYAANRADLFDLNPSAYRDLNLPKMPGNGAIDEEEYEAIVQKLKRLDRQFQEFKYPRKIAKSLGGAIDVKGSVIESNLNAIANNLNHPENRGIKAIDNDLNNCPNTERNVAGGLLKVFAKPLSFKAEYYGHID